MEFHSAIKKNEIMTCRKMGITGNPMFSKISHIQDKYLVFASYPQNLDLKLNVYVCVVTSVFVGHKTKRGPCMKGSYLMVGEEKKGSM